VRASGAKNAALPALAASLLTDEPVRLERVPKVRDVSTMRRLLAYVGVASRDEAETLVLAPGGAASPDDAPYELVKTMRASVLVLGPMLARRGHARVSLPGGCAIGVRPIDQHLLGLEALGARSETGERLRRGARASPARRDVSLRHADRHRHRESDDGGGPGRGTTRLENCAREPEVVDLARLLTAMGADLAGAGEDTIEIQGVAALHGAAHSVISDRIEGGTYLIGAALTGGDVVLEQAAAADLSTLLAELERAGAEVEVGAGDIRVRGDGELRPRELATGPHPGFPTDLQPSGWS
jgi:UDP-N-acetylglucosamine 1-carboxyvinyltransferase